ncbi:MAG TPA: hypothetical protein VKW78_17870 [Terriglobales bacterium]|nr:hypothetical protein [Terriglobales bacterium]
MRITREPYTAEVIDVIDPISRTRAGFRYVIREAGENGEQKKIFESPVSEDCDYCFNRAEDHLQALRERVA